MAESHIEKKEKKCVAKGQEKEKNNNKAEGLNEKKNEKHKVLMMPKA